MANPPALPAPAWEPAPVPHALLVAARTLRTDMTDAEQFLWQCLRAKQMGGFKFRRQHPFHQYVLDFYCASAKLAIELDGSGHDSDEGRSNDAIRSAFLLQHGIRVLRFWNNQLFQQTEAVLTQIWRALHPQC
jgi:very-short-patch-repair endonuclease